jgi:hypothetical protein
MLYALFLVLATIDCNNKENWKPKQNLNLQHNTHDSHNLFLEQANDQ